MSLKMSRRFISVFILACAWLGCAAQTRTVTILYTNDFHAAVEPMKATWLVDQPMIGGGKALGAWIAMMRRTEPNPFLFDSGDLFTGQAISTLTRGQGPIEIFKSIGYDAVCYGNHEFDYGIPVAEGYAKSEPFPVLSANLFYRSDGRPFARPYAIVARNGIRIGVIGIFGVDAVPSTAPAIWKTLEARDPIPILRELVPRLRKQVDLIVVLAHQGETGPMQSDAEAHPEVQRNFDADKATVAAVPGIDVFVGGHAHRGIEVPWVSPQTGSIVVQTYGRGTTLGVLQLVYDSAQRKVVGHSGNLVRVVPGVFPVPPLVDATITRWLEECGRLGKEQLGSVSSALTRSYDSESALGDLVTDAMAWKGAAPIAFENAGGIRFDLPAGPIALYDVVSAFPFINSLVTMDLTGKQIREILEQSLTLKVGMMQVAGLRVRYDPKRPEYKRVVEVEVAGQPLDDERVYRVATNSFVATGGDHYATFLDAKRVDDTGINIMEVLADYIRSKKTIDKPVEDRLVSASR